MASRKGNIILSYRDYLITEDDFKLLEPGNWLNDTIIGFYLEYLKCEKYVNDDICFVGPEVTQCLRFSDVQEFPIFLDPLEFNKKSFAIMPVNDCDTPDTAGGNHWSLLVYSKPELRFYHVDSIQYNNSVAEILAYGLSKYLSIPFDFKELASTKQKDSCNCGVFVLCNIDNIVSHALEFKHLENVGLLKSDDVTYKRQEVKSLINRLSPKS